MEIDIEQAFPAHCWVEFSLVLNRAGWSSPGRVFAVSRQAKVITAPAVECKAQSKNYRDII
jgi:hypothetical protein